MSAVHSRDRMTLLIVSSSLLAFLLGIALLVIGPTPIVLAPWDIFINLDEAWRLHTGQVPHTDFHNPVGPFTFALFSFGMRVVGPSLDAIVVGTVVFLVIAAISASIVAYRRLPPVHAFLFVIFIVFLGGATRQVGRGADIPTYAEIYNRYGWTLICILFLQYSIPVRPNARGWVVLEGLTAGVLLSLLLYIKVTYFAIGCGGLALALFLSPQWRRMRLLLWFVIGATAIALAFWLTTGIELSAYLQDVLEAGRAQTIGRRWGTIKETLRHSRRYVGALGIVWALLIVVPMVQRKLDLRTAIRITFSAAFIGVCALLVAFGNTGEGGEVPMLVIVGLFLLHQARSFGGMDADYVLRRRDWRYKFSTLIVVGVIAAPIFAQDILSIGRSGAWRTYRISTAPASQRFDVEPLRDFIIPHDTEWVTEFWKSAQLPARINDGFTLARKYVSRDQSILTLSFSNPFPYALGTRSPRGTPVWFDLNNNFNRNIYPNAAQLFGDVDFVMLPIVTDEDFYGGGKATTDTLQQIYAPYLNEHYSQAGRSAHWILLRKK